MLKFNGSWRFEAPEKIADEVVSEFSELIAKIATQGDVQPTLEHFKSYFPTAAGTTSSWSTSASWAQSDLSLYMNEAASNAPLFIEAFYDACDSLRAKDLAVPDVRLINRILAKHKTGYEIQPPNLISRNIESARIEVPAEPLSLEQEVSELIQTSLSQSEKLLSEGLERQAVQEVLWLLETVSTAFQGIDTGSGTVKGNYFNRIVADLRRQSQGTTPDQVLIWITTLHGYLSSPTGGGIRHGMDLKSGVATQPQEARLFCNLIRSYISFLLAEHARLAGTVRSR
jgi:hypothetical protein